jgi:hypothetical protein
VKSRKIPHVHFPDDDATNELFKKLNETQALNKSIVDISIKMDPSLQFITRPHLNNANIFTTIFFSTFAAVYGKIMWMIRSKLSPSYYRLAKIDKEQASQLRKLFLRERVIGRSVFALLFFDLVASTFLRYTSGEDISFIGDYPIRVPPEYRYKYPLSSLYPIIQTSIFLLAALWSIRKYRFVVLPLVISGCYYNQALVREIGVIDTIFKKFDSVLDRIK